MNILGIGPLELVLIFLIILLVIGPKDTVKTGRTIGRWLRSLLSSETWKTIRETSREIRNIPTKLIREAGIEDMNQVLPSTDEIRKSIGYDELSKDINQISTGVTEWTTPLTKVDSEPKPLPVPSSQPFAKSTTITQPEAPPAPNDWTTPHKKTKKTVEIKHETPIDQNQIDKNIPSELSTTETQSKIPDS